MDKRAIRDWTAAVQGLQQGLVQEAGLAPAVLGPVQMLLACERRDVAACLSGYLRSSLECWVTCSEEGQKALDGQRSEESLMVYLPEVHRICHNREEDVDSSSPQGWLKRLCPQPEVATVLEAQGAASGFIGYAANLVYLPPGLARCKVSVQRPGRQPAQLLTLRQSLVYVLFGSLMVFETDAHAQQFVTAVRGVGRGELLSRTRLITLDGRTVGIDKVLPQRWLHADEKQAAELDALVRPHLLFRPSGRTQLEQCQGRELHKRSTSYSHALLLDIVGAWFESNLKLLLVPRTSHEPTCPVPQLLWFAYFVGCKEDSVPPLDLGMARVQSRLVDLHAARRQPCPCQQQSNECEPAQLKLAAEQFGAAGRPLLGAATSCKVARRLRLMSPAQVFKAVRQAAPRSGCDAHGFCLPELEANVVLDATCSLRHIWPPFKYVTSSYQSKPTVTSSYQRDGGRLVPLQFDFDAAKDQCGCQSSGCGKTQGRMALARLQQRGVQCRLRLTHLGERGYGVLAEEGVSKDEFIVEYAGELVRGGTKQEEVALARNTALRLFYEFTDNTEPQLGPWQGQTREGDEERGDGVGEEGEEAEGGEEEPDDDDEDGDHDDAESDEVNDEDEDEDKEGGGKEESEGGRDEEEEDGVKERTECM
ncbi:hypothetical protein HaLaN_07721 [Haematococcus lacustris]|uniref:SET domain-containing protein n=1 Tax=Haematococcus lacustris TaxID=44745 RepID=A0A699YPN9_HAELA|nr:hypothetical protein HaLaN_07721 [Haematococcus lacustris]